MKILLLIMLLMSTNALAEDKCTEYHYLDKVRVTSGFYEGMTGKVIMNYALDFGICSYDVQFENDLINSFAPNQLSLISRR